MATTVSPQTTRRNWTYIVAVVIVYAFLLGAAAGSFTDIVKCSHMLGLRWQAWTVPFLLDGIALMGKLGRSARFAESTQRAGMKLMVFGGTLSLAANVAAGENTGQRAYGALLVVGFLLVEQFATKLRPAPAPVITVSEKRSAAAVKAAETRKANQERKAAEALKAQAEADRKAAERRERRRVATQVAHLEESLATS